MAEKKMIIDGVSCPFTTERNVLEVARNNGIDIPSLCYCENLSIYGGCRLCLVENDRGKMDAACSMQPRDGMVVNTHTKQVLDSRRTTLQLLMSSHRADCLTCDQSGRCKLQEYARRYHVDEHRFEPNTYCTEPMDLSSPSIVRDPSKCILCGLCVRTCAEIQNIGAVDFSGRGKKAHISADFGKTLKDTDCVGCGQCAAVCPTGAITIRNETEKFWSMLQDQTRKVVVQYAPSVRVGMAERFGLPANEPCTGKLVAALRRLGADVVYNHADYRLMSRRALDALAEYKEVNLFLRGLVPLVGYPSTVVYYERGKRFAGESKYPLRKMLSFAWEGVSSLTVSPLRLITRIGVVMFLVSIAMLIYFLVRYFTGHTVAGWSSLAVSIWAIGGLQLLAIGVVGEYIGKIYLETKARPRYRIETELDDREAEL